ncbi:hypothetical protein L1I79_40075 [Strepomyces sp. STD 3.1]|nr:hypothetical protein [Streptomyces sp. STD 3.1]
MFNEALREAVGMLVQIITPVDILTGTLMSVGESVAVIRTSSNYSPYIPSEDVTVRLDVITYVRLFESQSETA